MSIPKRDRVATLLVAASALVYGLWLIGFLGGLTAASVALVVLGLGFAASASAVVPGFAALIRGSRLYLALASIGGLIALTCGLLTVVWVTNETLVILIVATIGLWVAATVRHAGVAQS